MPLYEFRCKTCDDTFEVRRPMAESHLPALCPSGHDDAVRLLSVFASVGAPSSGSSAGSSAGSASGASSPAASMPSGGGCGSGCGCAH